MAATYAEPMSVPRRDPTADAAIERADLVMGPSGPLMVSIEERCGEQLIAAFLASANAYFTGRDATPGTSG